MLRRAKGRLALALALVACILAVGGVWMWRSPSLPSTPVPRLVVLGHSTVSIRAELVPASKSADSIPLSPRIAGRVVTGSEPGGIQHHWPGFYAEARFRGRAVTARFDDEVNRFRITLDGGAGGIVEISRPGAAELRISGLPLAVHDIRLEKISESPAPSLFVGFFVDNGGEALPPPDAAPKLIEFIGDSDTVGYGSTAQRRDCSNEQVFAATDSSRTFGPSVAAHFGADYRLVARSGIGLVRNADGAARGQTMPNLYARGLPDDAESKTAAERAPDIVVVGLGSNDFGSKLQADEPWSDHRALRRDFEPALIEFMRARQSANPLALFVLLAFGEYGDELVGAYRAAEKAMKRSNARTLLVILPKLDRLGCHWHPSPRDHAMIAQALITAIAAVAPD
jgi:lysophospholipase L1-like esterase